MKKALIFSGGWDGHKPLAVASILSAQLAKHGFDVTSVNHLEVLDDAESLAAFDLIVPNWTMGKLTDSQTANLCAAIAKGTGLGGMHGGMGDAFRGVVDYQWMVGGIFVAHPHVGSYTVRKTVSNPITDSLPESFEYNSEQYYMLVDPANVVLAETDYTHNGITCRMPVIWTKMWGTGRVFYSALGHDVDVEFVDHPAVLETTVRGLVWAAR